MRKLMLAAIGAALLAAAPAAIAQSPQSHPPGHDQGPGPGHGPGGPGPDRPGQGPGQGPGPNRPGGPDYGHWDNHWGVRPPAPPSHWKKHNGWYRHVRACQQRYRSYNPRTDTYRVRPGVYRRCML